MKVKEILRTVAFFLISAAAGISNTACTGKVDGEVPEGTLRIFVEGASSIVADGKQTVTFRVMYGSEDVSSSEDMTLIRTFEGKESRMAGGVHTFSTMAPGTYTFTARYYSTEAVYTDNEVTVTATPASSGEASVYGHKILGVQFTATSCTGCPLLSKAISTIQSERPGILCNIAFHRNYSLPDPMYIAASDVFAAQLMENTLPAYSFNMHIPSTGSFMVNEYSKINAELDKELETYSPQCGVALSTEYDETSRKVTITGRITSSKEVLCKYHVFLVEDGIEADQTGEKNYVHNNVVRAVLTSGFEGKYLNDRLPLYPGTEFTVAETATLEEGWIPENMRVVLAALVPFEGQDAFYCTNVNECALIDGSADYFMPNE